MQCFINQYHKFTVPKPNGEPLHVNGRLTLGENVADAGGVNAAFAAWKEAEGTEHGQLLPGLQSFSKEQVFFISYASWWCGKMRPEAAVNLIYRDPHAPGRARILGTMANSPDFRESFNVMHTLILILERKRLTRSLAVSSQGADLRVVVRSPEGVGWRRYSEIFTFIGLLFYSFHIHISNRTM